MTNTEHTNCEDHRNQTKVQDPFTGEWTWVCEGCGADCGEATEPRTDATVSSATDVAQRHADWDGFWG